MLCPQQKNTRRLGKAYKIFFRFLLHLYCILLPPMLKLMVVRDFCV